MTLRNFYTSDYDVTKCMLHIYTTYTRKSCNQVGPFGIATSSTEAEFYAAVTCAKVAKYLPYVLQELDAIQSGPTKLFIDNVAALQMINKNRPTLSARHIEPQHFAIQECLQKGDLIMEHLLGRIKSNATRAK